MECNYEINGRAMPTRTLVVSEAGRYAFFCYSIPGMRAIDYESVMKSGH